MLPSAFSGLALLTLLGLLLLTGLFWFGSRERATTTQGTLPEHDRISMLRRLRLRYETNGADGGRARPAECGS